MSIQAYQNQQDWDILGASPLGLVLALYGGALQSVRQARACVDAGKIRERSAAITRACAILQELTLTLDRSAGGEMAETLAELYIYMHMRLGEANITQRSEPLIEVEKLLEVLLEGWNQLAAKEMVESNGEPLRLSA